MKKHDEKKQGTTKSVNSRSWVKERKAKPNEMTNIVGSTCRNKTKLAAKNAWMRKKTKSNKRQKKTGQA